MKLNITKEEFVNLVTTKTNLEVCKQLHISGNTLWRYKKQLGIPNKPKGRPVSQVQFKEDK